jgi:hypothetical protein
MEDAVTPDANTGIAHYPERNWEKGLPLHSMIDSALRHLAKYVDGWTDEDHLCAAATNLLMAMWTEERRPEMQDIPSRMAKDANETDPTVEICVCWEASDRYIGSTGVCNGTKDRNPCCCGGDTKLCDMQTDKPSYWRDKQPKHTCICYNDGKSDKSEEAEAYPFCEGTDGLRPCTCGGDTSKCDFFESFRKKSKTIQ